MSQQQTFTIKQGIRLAANVRNNEYLLLMNIDNMQQQQGKDWYESTGSSTKNFLVHLSNLVNYNNFSDTGVEKLIKRLQENGYVLMEGLRIQVTEKWRNIVDEYGGYLNHGDKTTEQIHAEEDEKLLNAVRKGLRDVEQPKTQNIKVFRASVNKLVYDGNKAFKRKLIDANFKATLDELAKLLKSDYLLKQYFDNALVNNSRAAPPNAPTKYAPDKPDSKPNTEGGKYTNDEIVKQLAEREDWRIHLNMSQATFFSEMSNTKFWSELALKRGLPLTEKQQVKFDWCVEGLSDPEGSKAFYQKRIEKLKAEQSTATGPIDPSVLTSMAGIEVKKV